MAERAVKGRVLKLENNPHSLDFIGDAILARGYVLTRVGTPEDALDIALHDPPDLILVVDRPERGVDAHQWIGLQHAYPDPRPGMIPLLILAETKRLAEVESEAMPGRVAVLPLPVNLRALTDTLEALIWPWGNFSPE